MPADFRKGRDVPASPRVVLDTNVLISGLLWPNSGPGQVLDAALQKRIRHVTCRFILDELGQVLSSKFGHEEELIRDTVALIERLSEIVDPHPLRFAPTPDPADNLIIACAVHGRAGYLVTGDKRVLALKQVVHVQILSPKEFLSI